MNLPNKLTVIRVALSPILLAVMLADFSFNMAVALAIFCIASVTDYFDGRLARKNNMITTFGKFLDPIADKLLIFAALLGLMGRDCVFGMEWIIFIAISRELLVASARMLAASDGNVIAADIWGKTKTVSQMISVIAVLLFEQVKIWFDLSDVFVSVFDIAGSVMMWITAFFTVLSGINYLISCAKYIKKSI